MLFLGSLALSGAPFDRPLPHGGRLRLGALVMNGDRAWTPDGHPLPKAEIARWTNGGGQPAGLWVGVEIRAPYAETPSVFSQVAGMAATPAASIWRVGPHIWRALLDGNGGLVRRPGQRISFRVGIAGDGWTAMGAVAVSKTGATVRQGTGFVRGYRPWDRVGADRKSHPTVVVEAVMPSDTSLRTYRIRVRGKEGRQYPVLQVKSGRLAGSVEWWFDGSYDRVAKLMLEGRSITWNGFTNVKFEPDRR